MKPHTHLVEISIYLLYQKLLSHFSALKIGQIFLKKHFCEVLAAVHLLLWVPFIIEMFWNFWFLEYVLISFSKSVPIFCRLCSYFWYIGLTVTSFFEKICTFFINACMVSFPTWKKNLWRYLNWKCLEPTCKLYCPRYIFFLMQWKLYGMPNYCNHMINFLHTYHKLICRIFEVIKNDYIVIFFVY